MKKTGGIIFLLVSIFLFLIFTNAISTPDFFLKDRLERRITKEVRNKCSLDEECILDLKDITGFEWDELFVFYDNYKSDQNTIREGTNTNTDCSKKSGNVFGDLWIFFHKNKEVKCLEIYATPFEGRAGLVFGYNKFDPKNKFYKVTNNSIFVFSIKDNRIIISEK